MSPKKKSSTNATPTPPSQNSGAELRTAPRFGFEAALPYRILREPEKEEADRLEADYQASVAKNISLGGLCMMVKEALRPGTLVEVQIPSIFSDGSVPVEAQVMWSDKVKTDFYIGVAFQGLTDEASVSIQKMVKQLG